MKDVVRPFTLLPARELSQDLYFDLGAADEVFTAEIGVGECAS